MTIFINYDIINKKKGDKNEINIIKKILSNYIKNIHGDELKCNKLINNFNDKVKLIVHVSLLNKNKILNTIAEETNFIQIHFFPLKYFQYQKWENLIKFFMEKYKR